MSWTWTLCFTIPHPTIHRSTAGMCQLVSKRLTHFDIFLPASPSTYCPSATHSVTSMNSMLYGAYSFDLSLQDWVWCYCSTSACLRSNLTLTHLSFLWQNTSSVTNMDYVFGADAGLPEPMRFNQPIGNWQTSNVNTMKGTFLRSSYNQPLGGSLFVIGVHAHFPQNSRLDCLCLFCRWMGR